MTHQLVKIQDIPKQIKYNVLPNIKKNRLARAAKYITVYSNNLNLCAWFVDLLISWSAT